MDVKIVWCKPCNFLERAEAMKSSIEKEFGDKVKVALEEGEKGIFDIYAGSELVFSRKKEGRFPELEEIVAKLKGEINE